MQSLVWAGALNRHAHAAFGVEEEGRTVAITQFTRTVYGRMIGRDEGEAEGVATTERGRDLGIAADGVAFAGEVGAEGRDELEDDAEIGGDRSLRGVECIRQGGALHRQRGRWDADGGRGGRSRRRFGRGSCGRRGPKEPEQQRADRDEEREREGVTAEHSGRSRLEEAEVGLGEAADIGQDGRQIGGANPEPCR